jgi:ankyrin repeat protein
MAYYYCDFRDIKRQDRYGLLSSLVSQLSAESDGCYDVLLRLRSSHAGGTRKPTSDALTECMKDMLSLPEQGEIYIIIDALDECPDTSGTLSAREEVLELVAELVCLNLPNVHLCVTSRPEVDIRSVLAPLTSLQISLHDERGQREDIMNYIDAFVHSDRRMRKWREEDLQLVINSLSNKANGMSVTSIFIPYPAFHMVLTHSRRFQYVACQLDRLRRCFPESIESFLNDLPESLDETYGRALLGIDKEKRKYTQRLLQCLTVSVRPFSVEELAEIVAVRFDDAAIPTFNPKWRQRDAKEAVLSACSSLISIVDIAGSQIVQFSHFSIKEFLTSERLATAKQPLSCYHISPERAHATLARASLSVLLHLGDDVDRDAIHHLPLAPYAAQHWIEHARFGKVSSQVQGMMEHLFDSSEPHFATWIWLYDLDHHWLEPMSEIHPTQPSATPLYYASLCGLRSLVESLVVMHPHDVNARGGCFDTPLLAASAKGHSEVVKLLLNNNADIRLCDDEDSGPLHWASIRGHVEVVKTLLDRGVNVDQKEKSEWTSLHLASSNGRVGVSRLLIQHGAVVDARDCDQSTPLYLAVEGGALDIVRLLLDSGASVNVTEKHGWTPLHSAAYMGYHGIINWLLSFGASHDARNNAQQTPLALACHNGKLEVSRILLDRGADMNSRDVDGFTPLHLASQEGHIDITQLLLDRGADVGTQDADGWFPLHFASVYGYLQVTQLLIERGASVDSRNGDKETPLVVASVNGHLDVARFLVEHGADVSSHDGKGWAPLHTASKIGRLPITKFLLECGVDVDIRNKTGQTPLNLASGSGKLDVVHFLIEKGADIHTKDNEGWNPLHVAAQNGHLDIIHLLVDTGLVIDIRNNAKITPLISASINGRVEVSEFLLERGADMNARNGKGCAPLHFASRYGHLGTTRLLLDRGVDPDIQGDDGWRPLLLASANSHVEVAQLLIQRGATVDMFNNEQQTSLWLAAGNGTIEIMHLLLDSGANLQMSTYLMVATRQQRNWRRRMAKGMLQAC